MKKSQSNWRKAMLITVIFFASAVIQVLALNAFLIPNQVFQADLMVLHSCYPFSLHKFFMSIFKPECSL